MNNIIARIKEFLKKLLSIFSPPQSNLSATEYRSPYKRKYRVMNASEQALYINLQKALGNEFIVLSKVRIEDFVEVEFAKLTKSEHWGFRGKIKSRHVDFLVCDLASTKPILAIELDGASHNNTRRMARDYFVNDLYSAIGLRVVHVHVGSNFSEEAVGIKNILLQGV